MKRLLAALIGCLAVSAMAADSFNGSGWVFQSNATTNTYPTNGVYPCYIGTGVLNVTNIMKLNNSALDTTAIQVTAAASGSSTTNATFVLYAATAPVSLSVNTNQGMNPGVYTNLSTTPLAYFDTITLGLAGTSPVCTNKSYSPSTTPPKAKGLNLYLYYVGMGAGTVSLTNYSVYVNNY